MDPTRDHDMSNTTSNITQELYVWQKFNDTKSMRCVVNIYSMKSHHTFVVPYSSAKYEEYRCPKYDISCNLRVQACQCSCEHLWKIIKYNEAHTYLLALLSQDHPKLDTDVISSFIITMVTKNLRASIWKIIKRIHSIYGYMTKKAWKGKHRSIAIMFREWENSYSLLPR